jgi:hypothetical protein
MVGRRCLTFFREPRQWLMVVSPVIATVTTTLFFYSLVNLLNTQTANKDTNALTLVISMLLPILLLIGFSTSCGIYMLTPLYER